MAKKEATKKDDGIKAKALSPFDIIKMMFTDQTAFHKLSDNMLERNFFIINRVFGIQYPLQAQCFNINHVNGANAVKSWAIFAEKTIGLGKVPSFVYTKSSKSTVAKDEKISKDTISQYCAAYKLSLRDFNDMNMYLHDDLIADMERFEKIMSSKNQEKNFTKQK